MSSFSLKTVYICWMKESKIGIDSKKFNYFNESLVMTLLEWAACNSKYYFQWSKEFCEHDQFFLLFILARLFWLNRLLSFLMTSTDYLIQFCLIQMAIVTLYSWSNMLNISSEFSPLFFCCPDAFVCNFM